VEHAILADLHLPEHVEQEDRNRQLEHKRKGREVANRLKTTSCSGPDWSIGSEKVFGQPPESSCSPLWTK
jgi:hypothetical protein